MAAKRKNPEKKKERFCLRKAAGRKLKSERGASVLFTMLLFLVTMVLCLVLTSAASAAAGVISNMTKNDQRYYAVASARELLRSLVEERPVSVVKAQTSRITENEDGTVQEEEVSSGTFVLEGTEADDLLSCSLSEREKLLTEENKAAVCRSQSIVKNAADALVSGETISGRMLEIKPQNLSGVHADAQDAIRVTVKEELGKDGELTFLLSSAKDGGEKPLDSTVRFQVETETMEDSFKKAGEIKLEENGSYCTMDLVTVFRVTSCRWHLADINS